MAHRGRSSFGSGRVSAVRRSTAWELGPGGDDVLLDAVAISNDSTNIIGSGVAGALPGLTVIRVHGFIDVQLTVATAAQDGFNMFCGLAVVELDAFTVGASAMQDPFDNAAWGGWMWHWMGAIHTAVGGLAIGDPPNNPMRIPIETKSMRKLGNSQVLTLIMQVGENTTGTISVAAATRVLLKLP